MINLSASFPVRVRPVNVQIPSSLRSDYFQSTLKARKTPTLPGLLFYFCHRNRIHIRKFFILSRHAPYKSITDRADPKMDAPGR